MTTAFGSFGVPPDAFSWASLFVGLAILALVSARPRSLPAVTRRPGVVAFGLAALAAVLSIAYVHGYLRGGPRIIDATSYYLEGRGLAAGHFAFPVVGPSGSYRGRFLLASDGATALSVIFPPGYPLVLAAGFLAGAPLLVGPALGALLVLATYWLSRSWFGDVRVALVAAALSALSGTLRYHTADTMAHAWSALLGVVTIVSSCRSTRGSALVAGLALGWLVATRPTTGIVFGAVSLGCLRNVDSRLLPFAGTAMVGASPLLFQQLEATGSAARSLQLAYYALADGPPGCFTYGFGAGIGCRTEHGDFVRHNLNEGYGLIEAAGTTLRRLKMHLLDVGNLELFALAVPVAVWIGRHDVRVRRLGLLVLAVIVGYAPFYFDGNYPGGGARLYMDAIAFEQVLVAWLVVRLGVARFAVPAALLGFSLHASFEHHRLSEREGGRPMFEPQALARAGVGAGLVFVSTDHGFNLGHRPGDTELVVARHRGDAHDWLLWNALGRPPAFRYEYDPAARSSEARVRRYAVPFSRRLEAEAEWPPLEVSGGWVAPVFSPCASGGRGIELRAEERATARAVLELVVEPPGEYRLRVGWMTGAAPPRLALDGRALEISGRDDGPCRSSDAGLVRADRSRATLVFETTGVSRLDYVELAPAGPPGEPPQGPRKRR